MSRGHSRLVIAVGIYVDISAETGRGKTLMVTRGLAADERDTS